jgi:hypothetical protein
MEPARVADMNAAELRDWVRGGELTEADVLDALRNPYCSTEVAEAIADRPELLAAHTVRELLSSFRGLAFARAMDLIATLPWTSLLALAQNPKTPPMIGRQAEKKLLAVLARMNLGEKVALARRVHRPLLRPLIDAADRQVLVALLDNQRLTENDVLLILNTAVAPPEFYADLARHHRWGQSYAVHAALVRCRHAPLPVALSALVQLRSSDLEAVAARPDVPEPVRSAAAALKEKEDKGLRRVIEYPTHDSRSTPAACESEGLR